MQPTTHFSAASVLIVDDDVRSLNALAEILDFEGYSVACSENGKQALEYLHNYPLPSLIIMDLCMPVMDGWQFRTEQKKDASIARVPVVVVTAFSDPVDIDAEAIIPKPIDLERLLSVVHHYC